MNEFECDYCGKDLLADFIESTGMLDTVHEIHLESCQEFQRTLSSKTQQSPLCDGDEE